jgi:ACT domain-containing protein
MKNAKMQIQSYLLEKMKNQDIHTIKVKELVDCLHISRSTFYLYYASIFAVLQDIEDIFLKGFNQLQTHSGHTFQIAIT